MSETPEPLTAERVAELQGAVDDLLVVVANGGHLTGPVGAALNRLVELLDPVLTAHEPQPGARGERGGQVSDYDAPHMNEALGQSIRLGDETPEPELTAEEESKRFAELAWQIGGGHPDRMAHELFGESETPPTVGELLTLIAAHSRAASLERELAEARETSQRLNRRVGELESQLARDDNERCGGFRRDCLELTRNLDTARERLARAEGARNSMFRALQRAEMRLGQAVRHPNHPAAQEDWEATRRDLAGALLPYEGGGGESAKSTGPFVVRLVCCGRDDGVYGPVATWDEAESFRRSYISAEGHTRSAIIEAAPTDRGAALTGGEG